MSSCSSKHTSSLNVFPKPQQSIKQNDIKLQASSNQSPTSSRALTSTLNKCSPINKLNQKPTSSINSAISITPLPSVSKQLVGNVVSLSIFKGYLM